jgi:hypothetical protein
MAIKELNEPASECAVSIGAGIFGFTRSIVDEVVYLRNCKRGFSSVSLASSLAFSSSKEECEYSHLEMHGENGRERRAEHAVPIHILSERIKRIGTSSP